MPSSGPPMMPKCRRTRIPEQDVVKCGPGPADKGDVRHIRPLVTAALAALIAIPVAASAMPAGAVTQPGPNVEVIVGGPNAAAEVVAAGGQVTLDLPLINGVAATLPANAAGDLVDDGLVVVPDAPAKVVSDNFDATTHDVQMAAL